MKVEAITVGAFEVECYLAWGSAGQALAIDPGAQPELIRARLTKLGLELAGCLLTHGHMDHVSALAGLLQDSNAFWAIHRQDLDWTFSESNCWPPFYEIPQRPTAPPRLLEDGEEFDAAGLKIHVIWTPGHSPGGVCYYFPAANILFSGDTIFRGTVGRTDLPAADARQLTASLQKLARLPDNTRIFPGHGPATTLADEFQNNPFISRPR